MRFNPETNYNGNYSEIINDIEITHFNTSHGLPSNEVIRAFNVMDNLYFGSYSGLFVFDESNEVFMPDTTISKYLDNAEVYIGRIHVDKQRNLWLSSESDRLFIFENNEYFDRSYVLRRLPSMSVFAYHSDSTSTFLGGTEGLFRFNNNHVKDFKKPFYTLIRSVHISNDSLIIFGSLNNQDEQVIDIEHRFNSIALTFSAPFYENEKDMFFSYKLEGFDKDWSAWSKERR